MPGAVVDVRVRVGDVVKANQEVIVLNAMKMETVLTAPFDGVVTSVDVAVGDIVDGNDLLVTIQKKE
jgi:biotin carboxyl carrier protein